MNIKEQIKAEIERLIEINKTKNGFPAGTICAARIEAYEVLLERIDSLPEEQPSEDLEEEISGMYQALFGTDIIYRKEMLYLETFETIARHFAQWQKDQMMKEAISCEVIGEKRDLRLINSTERCLFDAERGDWLKIIIVKED